MVSLICPSISQIDLYIVFMTQSLYFATNVFHSPFITIQILDEHILNTKVLLKCIYITLELHYVKNTIVCCATETLL